MNQLRFHTRNIFVNIILAGALGLAPTLATAETPVELMKQGQIEMINLPYLIINDRTYTLAGNVSIRQRGHSVGSVNLSKGQTIAFTTGRTETDNRIITEIVIAPGR